MFGLLYRKSDFQNHFFAKQQQAIDEEETYLDQCIKVRLIPFLERHHNKEKVLFWPDLASSHYGHKVTQYRVRQK